MIPNRFIRTVPRNTSDEVEGFWETFRRHHPGWEFITYRDPIDPRAFPLTSDAWGSCQRPAQMAGLVRLEALWHLGGIYVDSDVECYRSFAPLTRVEAFAGWEDRNCVPDAVIGARRHHPVIGAAIELALERLASDSDDWRSGNGPWATGPGVTTTLLPGRDDVLLLPPGSLYPYHYSRKHKDRARDHRAEQPWAFCAHHWHHSWA